MTENRALVVASHPDDEILGCGATIAKLARDGWSCHSLILAEGATSRSETRDREANIGSINDLRGCAMRAAKCIGAQQPQLLDFPDNRMDGVDLLDVVKAIEAAIKAVRPTRVFTHANCDVNIDHRVVHDAVIAATRPQPEHYRGELFFFETVSSTEWRPPASLRGFQPSVFCDVSETLDAKLDALRQYETEMRCWPHPRSLAGVEHLAYVRGATVGVRAAEAFEVGRFYL